MGTRFKSEVGHTVFIRDLDSRDLSLDENKRVFARSFERTLRGVAQGGRRVLVVSQVPETEWNVPYDMARARILGRRIDFRPTFADYVKRNAFVQSVFERSASQFGLEQIHPETWMCAKTFCTVENAGIPVYRDSTHITRTQSERLAGLFEDELAPMMTESQ